MSHSHQIHNIVVLISSLEYLDPVFWFSLYMWGNFDYVRKNSSPSHFLGKPQSLPKNVKFLVKKWKCIKFSSAFLSAWTISIWNNSQLTVLGLVHCFVLQTNRLTNFTALYIYRWVTNRMKVFCCWYDMSEPRYEAIPQITGVEQEVTIGILEWVPWKTICQ